MTHTQLVDAVSAKAALTQHETNRCIDAIIDVIKNTVNNDSKLYLKGIGSFQRTYMEPRTGRNPQTGESLEIDGKFRTKFKQSLSLSRYINGEAAETDVDGDDIDDDIDE